MATQEEIRAELERRGLIDSTGRVATRTVAPPAKPNMPLGYSEGQMYDTLKAVGKENAKSLPRKALDVAAEFAGGANDTVIKGVDALTSMHPWNVGVKLAGREDLKIPSLAKALEKYGIGGKGGYMKPGLARDITRMAGETLPYVLPTSGAAGAAVRAAKPPPTLPPGASTKGLEALRAAAGKPRITAAQMAAMRRGEMAVPQFADDISRVASGIQGGLEGAVLDVGQSVTTGDNTPGFTAAGALAGLFGPKSLRRLMVNNPTGRLITSRLAGKVLGDKVKPWVFTGLHPATRRAAAETLKEVIEKGYKGG